MDFEGLHSSPIGHLVPISGTSTRTGKGYTAFAFLPEPLPAAVDLSPGTWNLVAKAEAAVARLDQAASQVPNPGLLRGPAIRREAQSTTALEGTYAPIEDVLGPSERTERSPEAREVLNYVEMTEQAFALPAAKPLTEKHLCQLQAVLVRDTASDGPDAGRLRRRQVFIGSPDAPIAEARFIPPPPGEHLSVALKDLLGWVNSPPPEMPAVVAAGLTHYQFETIHPFTDGNGRIGRMLIVLQMIRSATLTAPVLGVSPWFERRRSDYHDALLELSITGDWDRWIRFFADGIANSASETTTLIADLLTTQAETVARARDAGARGVAERVAEDLIGFPVLRASWVAERHGVTQQAAMNALRRLTELEVLEESAAHGGRVFVAREVVRLLSASTR